MHRLAKRSSIDERQCIGRSPRRVLALLGLQPRGCAGSWWASFDHHRPALSQPLSSVVTGFHRMSRSNALRDSPDRGGKRRSWSCENRDRNAGSRGLKGSRLGPSGASQKPDRVCGFVDPDPDREWPGATWSVKSGQLPTQGRWRAGPVRRRCCSSAPTRGPGRVGRASAGRGGRSRRWTH